MMQQPPDLQPSTHAGVAWRLAVALLLGFALLGSFADRDLTGALERGYALVVQEMVRDGHWLLPTQNGNPRILKPLLPFWLSAIPAKILYGDQAPMAVMRLVCALLGLVTLTSIFAMGTLMRNARTGLLAALIWTTSYLALFEMRNAQHDASLTAFVAVTMLGCWMALHGRPGFRRDSTGWWLAILGLFLAVQAKGPVSMALTLLPLLVYILLFQRAHWLLAPVLTGVGLFSIVLLALWAIFMVRSLGFDFNLYWWEIVGRFNSPVVERDPPWHYLSVLYHVFPWTFLFLAAWMKPLFMRCFGDGFARARPYAFAWLWLTVGLLILSLPREKTDRYAFPLMSAAALLMALWISDGESEDEKPRWMGWVGWTHASILLLVVIALWLTPFFLPDFSWGLVAPCALLVSLPVAVCFFALARYKHQLVLIGCTAFGFLFYLVVLGVEARHPRFREPLRQVAQLVSNRVGDAPIYTWPDTRPPMSLVYYMNRPAPTLCHWIHLDAAYPGWTNHPSTTYDNVLLDLLRTNVHERLYVICAQENTEQLRAAAKSAGYQAVQDLDLTTRKPPRGKLCKTLYLMVLFPDKG